MNKLSASAADELGRRLHREGFRPLPEVDDDGELIGTRLWRVRGGYVECLALRRNGLAYALMAEASFDYRRPAEHGAVVEFQAGHATIALDWLLRSASAPSPRLPRAYVRPAIPDHGIKGVIDGTFDDPTCRRPVTPKISQFRTHSESLSRTGAGNTGAGVTPRGPSKTSPQRKRDVDLLW